MIGSWKWWILSWRATLAKARENEEDETDLETRVKMNANEVSANVHDHGKVVDQQKNRVQCNYCAKSMSGFSRLRYHLGCRQSWQGVGTLEYPDLPWKRKWYPSPSAIEHRKLQTTQKAGSDSRKDVQKDTVSENGVTKEVSLPNGRRGSQKVEDHKEREDSSSRQAKKCIGRFFYELGTDLSAATSPSFQRMITAALGCGQIGYKLPSCQELKGWILKRK
ncbi:hypothetical protein CK203_039669 [Vitis vinifera]|uniref:Uncharacterized protein n=1 Tax=Vitis vinifera TaxID=29760 RepID=A0A438HFL8_VITVI|nr:hypothetical protein CK203_039669 [Vitis vinifera]